MELSAESLRSRHPGAESAVGQRHSKFAVVESLRLESTTQTNQRRRDQGHAAAECLRENYLRSVQGGARLLGERTKGLRVADGDVGEDLPIHFDAGEAKPVDEDAVAHVVLAGGRGDAGDPEAAGNALFVLAIAVRVLPTALDVLLGRLPQLGASAEGALGVLEDLLLPLEARDVRYGAWHGRLLLRGLDQALDSLLLAVRGDEPRAAQVALPLRGLLGQDVALEGLVPLDLAGTGGAEALLGALVG